MRAESRSMSLTEALQRNDASIRRETNRMADSRRKALNSSVIAMILARMKETDVSETELARRLGMSFSCVSSLLNGKKLITLPLLSDIASVLNMTPVIDFKKYA